MAIEYSFSAEGFETLFKRMDELRDEIGKAKTDRIYRDAMTYAFEPVLQDAKAYAPYKTGQLQKHIYMKAHRPNMLDRGSKFYQGESYLVRVTSSPIRDESQINFVLNKKGRMQAYWTKMRPVPISQEKGNKRTPKHEFLKPALDNNIENIKNRLGEALMAQINKIAEGKK